MNARFKFFFTAIILIIIFTPLYSQENISREDFYSFLTDYIRNLQSTRTGVDTSLSSSTNLELKVRRWNDYLSGVLPRKFIVAVPVEDVKVGREKYNRSEVEINYEFQIKFPQRNFRYENNISNPEGSLKLQELQQVDDGQKWVILIPHLQRLQVQSNLARKFDVLNNHGFLLFDIRLNYSREGGWTQFYYTVITLSSVRWSVDNETIWQLESLPFDDIIFREHRD
jgi:hypothetical protein